MLERTGDGYLFGGFDCGVSSLVQRFSVVSSSDWISARMVSIQGQVRSVKNTANCMENFNIPAIQTFHLELEGNYTFLMKYNEFLLGENSQFNDHGID